MHFLINELSFLGQAKDIYKADKLMNEIVSIIKEIDKIKSLDPIQKHSSLSSRCLTPDLTVYQWLQTKFKSSDTQDRTLASFLIQITSKLPFIDVQIQTLLNTCKCHYKEKDVSDSSISGAAYLKGRLISLQDASEFSDEYITVNFSIEKQNNENIDIHNLTQTEQARKICPRYQSSPKHDLRTLWKDAALMDLSDEEAQIALNQSLQSGKQRYSYYSRQFYVFQPDNAFDAQGYPTYHGYPEVDSEKIPNEVRKKLEE